MISSYPTNRRRNLKRLKQASPTMSALLRLTTFVGIVAALFVGDSQVFGQFTPEVPRPAAPTNLDKMTADRDQSNSGTPHDRPADSFPGLINSILRLNNMRDDKPATATVTYRHPDGTIALTNKLNFEPGLQPDSAVTLHLSDGPIGRPFSGSVTIEHSQPLAALHTKEAVSDTGIAIGMVKGVSLGFTRQYLPLLVKNFAPTGVSGPLDSRFVIQNASTSEVACVRIVYYNTRGERIHDDGLRSDSPDCPSRGMAIAPLSHLERDLSLETTLGSSFAGTAVVVVERNANDIPAPITSAIDIWNDRQFGSLEGAGFAGALSRTDGAHRTLLFPMVAKNWGSLWNSHVMLQNTSLSKDVWVQLTFKGKAIPNGESTTRMLLQRNRWIDLSQLPDDLLPDNFVGNLMVRSLAADMVTEGTGLITGAAITAYEGAPRIPLLAYRTIPADAATHEFLLPLIHDKRHGLNTRLAIMPADDAPTNIIITAVPEYCCTARTRNRELPQAGQPFGSFAWLPDGFVGTARVCSTGGRIAVLAINENSMLVGDTWATYAGIARKPASTCRPSGP